MALPRLNLKGPKLNIISWRASPRNHGRTTINELAPAPINQKYILGKRDNYVTYFICCGVRMVHAFTCAGMLPVHYKNMTSFAKIGPVGECYISHGISPLSQVITIATIAAIYFSGQLDTWNVSMQLLKIHDGSSGRNKRFSYYADKG